METIFSLLWSLVVGTFKFAINTLLFIIHAAGNSSASTDVEEEGDFYAGTMSADEALSKGKINIAEFEAATRRSRD